VLTYILLIVPLLLVFGIVAAVRRQRQIYWPDLGKRRATPVYDGELLASGNKIAGPAIVETADTTVVVQPRTRLCVDELGNFELTFK